MSEKRDWLTLSEAAKRIGVTRQRMHQIIGELSIKTMPVNPRLTMIHSKEVEKLRKKRAADNKSA